MRPRRRRSGAILAAGLLAAGVAAAGCGSVATAERALHPRVTGRPVLTASAALPADCVPHVNAPPYQLGITGTIRGGSITAGPVSITGIDANICGIVQLGPGSGGCTAVGTVTIPADGQVFAPLRAVVTLVPGQPLSVPFTVVPETISGSFGCGSSVDGLKLNIAALVAGSTGLFGVSCTIGPLDIGLAGVAGSPSYQPPTTSLSDITGVFTSSDFAIPAVTPDQRCPSGVAANLDPIAGLPIAAGVAKLSLPFVTSLYQPG